MARFISKFLIILAFIIIGVSVSAQAATISRSSHSECAILIDGTITEGDSKEFNKLAMDLALIDGQSDGETWNNASEAICLNSPGGSWLEGRQIAEMTFEFGITTRILSGDECLSACSLIFMSGRTRGEEFDGPSRFLNVLGKLGFHGPYLVPPKDKVYTASEMHDVSVFQNRIISDFIRFGSNGYTFSNHVSVAMSLVGEMLAYGPSEMLYADTIERVARWNISLEGARKEQLLDKQRIFQACENTLAWPFDRSARTLTESNYEYEPEVEIKTLGEKTYATVQFSGDANRTCQIRLGDKTDSNPILSVESISVCTDDGERGISTGDCPDFEAYYPSYYALPPSAPILSLAE